jgi:hypothetical protein
MMKAGAAARRPRPQKPTQATTPDAVVAPTPEMTQQQAEPAENAPSFVESEERMDRDGIMPTPEPGSSVDDDSSTAVPNASASAAEHASAFVRQPMPTPITTPLLNNRLELVPEDQTNEATSGAVAISIPVPMMNAEASSFSATTATVLPKRKTTAKRRGPEPESSSDIASTAATTAEPDSTVPRADGNVTNIRALCAANYRAPGSTPMSKPARKKRKGSVAAPQQEQLPPPPIVSATPAAAQVRIVNGQIVVDETSLQVGLDPALHAATLQRVHEDHGSRHITSASYLKREASHKWSAEETDLFFDGLRCWGTDFEMMARTLFKGVRTRHQIKLKFNREERACPVLLSKKSDKFFLI